MLPILLLFQNLIHPFSVLNISVVTGLLHFQKPILPPSLPHLPSQSVSPALLTSYSQMMSLGCFFSESFSDILCTSHSVIHWAALAASLSESVSATRFTSHSHRNLFPAALLTSYFLMKLLAYYFLSEFASATLCTSHSRCHWAATLSESVSVICTRHSCRHHWLFPAASQHCKAASCSEFVFRRSFDLIFLCDVTRLLFFQNPNPPLF
jgi:hypothetical protein